MFYWSGYEGPQLDSSSTSHLLRHLLRSSHITFISGVFTLVSVTVPYYKCSQATPSPIVISFLLLPLYLLPIFYLFLPYLSSFLYLWLLMLVVPPFLQFLLGFLLVPQFLLMSLFFSLLPGWLFLYHFLSLILQNLIY